jgi:hypothetical protein
VAGTIVSCNGCCCSGEIVVLDVPELVPMVVSEGLEVAPAADPPLACPLEAIDVIAAPPLETEVPVSAAALPPAALPKLEVNF